MSLPSELSMRSKESRVVGRAVGRTAGRAGGILAGFPSLALRSDLDLPELGRGPGPE